MGQKKYGKHCRDSRELMPWQWADWAVLCFVCGVNVINCTGLPHSTTRSSATKTMPSVSVLREQWEFVRDYVQHPPGGSCSSRLPPRASRL